MNSLATLFRSTVLRSSINDFRAFHSTPIVAKTVTEKVTDVADKVCVLCYRSISYLKCGLG